MKDSIYLDHNATTPMLPEVAEAIREASLRYPANPGSQHEPGRQARRALEDARDQIGHLLAARIGGMQPDRVIFTSGGTEANNLAILGTAHSPTHLAGTDSPGHFITSSIEHPCVAEPFNLLETQGNSVIRASVDKNGVVNADEIHNALTPKTRLVSLMFANNETGVVQPVEQVAQFCAQHGVPLHTDAAQAVGKLPIDFADLDLAMLTCAAHKFHGPPGIGALVLKHGITLNPVTLGGHQQADLRPGTETVALAVGMCTALAHWHREADQNRARITSLRDQFEHTILSAEPSASVVGKDSPRLPNTSNIAFAGLDRQALVMALDLEGVACSTGSACSSGSSELSPTLVAMGIDKVAAEGAVRFSLGVSNTPSQIETACRRILSCCQRLRRL